MEPNIQIAVGSIKVNNMGGTSSFIIGKAKFENVSSYSKTNNGIGNSYGDGSYINMSPDQTLLKDYDEYDNIPSPINPTKINTTGNRVPPQMNDLKF